MGDRHGGRFARRGRTLSPSRPQVDAHRGVDFRWRAVVFRWRGVVGRICPRENAPLGEGIPTRHTSERICPAQKHSPRRRPPDTAHEQKNLPRRGTLSSAKASRHGTRAKGFARAGTLPSAKASRHGARAKGFAPRRNALLGEGFPTRRTSERICPAGVRVRPTCRRTAGRSRPTDSRKNTPSAGSHPRPRTSERICPAQKRSPRRRPPDTAHERKGLPAGVRVRPTAKASRHGARAKGFAPRGFAFAPHADERRAAPDRRTAGKTPLRRGRTRDRARAKGFAPRRNVPLGEGLPTRRTGERICPTQERSPRRRPPDTAHGRKDLPHARTLSPHVPTNGGPPSTDGQPKKHPFGGVAPERARPLPSSFTEKK